MDENLPSRQVRELRAFLPLQMRNTPAPFPFMKREFFSFREIEKGQTKGIFLKKYEKTG